MSVEKLYEDLKTRYDAGAKTLVMNREEAEMVLSLLEKSKQILRGSELAKKYLNREINR